MKRSRARAWDELAGLATEAVHPGTRDLDLLGEAAMVRRIHREDLMAWKAVGSAIPRITEAARLASAALASGGRILYVGAGTSGRLGVLDAAECPPTFGAPTTRVRGVIAGGARALRRSIEGAEDKTGEGRRAIRALRAGPLDLVVGIAASRRTPYVLAALAEARGRGCRTVFIHCNPPGAEERGSTVVIRLPVGPEILAGSTRMKSGSAQKMVLNLISTVAWVRQGKAFGNLMVDLEARSEKLRVRGLKLLVLTTGLDRGDAARLLKKAGGEVKLAIYMARTGAGAREGRAALRAAGGMLRAALDAAGAPSDPHEAYAAPSLRGLGARDTVRRDRIRGDSLASHGGARDRGDRGAGSPRSEGRRPARGPAATNGGNR